MANESEHKTEVTCRMTLSRHSLKVLMQNPVLTNEEKETISNGMKKLEGVVTCEFSSEENPNEMQLTYDYTQLRDHKIDETIQGIGYHPRTKSYRYK
jgi:hypothetical protein